MPIREHLWPGFRRVPELTIFFWIVKLLTTAMGESTSDYLVHTIDPVVAVLMGAAAFSLAMAIQLLVRRYYAPTYWLAVLMVAVFGTMCADVLHIVIGIPYAVSATFFAVALVIEFAVWHRVEGTLSIHSIDSLDRELFYWLAVGTTFALGTATGDMTATTLGLGYLLSGVLFAVLFVLPALAYRFLGANSIACFWIGYVLTRPVGASFADWTGRTPDLGGIGIGQLQVTVMLGLAILAFVVYLTVSRIDVKAASPDKSRISMEGDRA